MFKKIILLIITISSLSSALAFDQEHKLWGKVLEQNTKRVGGQVLVNYKNIKANQNDLNSYLSLLENLTSEEFNAFSENEKLAFWINAYNAYTVKWIVKHYPIKSIKDTGSLFTSAWSKVFINLFNKKMSLDDIEHGTIRKNFKEPRIHFAVNCASIGCPSLYEKPFTAVNLEQELEAVTKMFLGNKNKNNVIGDKLKISKIFKWYGKDFDILGGVHKFLRVYIDIPEKINIYYLSYDWDLNDLK